MSKNKIKVFDTISNKNVYIEVDNETYNAYMRTGWNIADNDKSFFKHEIQFTMLKKDSEDNYETFHEFLFKSDSVEEIVISRIESQHLHKCLSKLKDAERQIIHMLYFENKTERHVAEILHTTQQNVHKKKLRILRKIKVFLESD